MSAAPLPAGYSLRKFRHKASQEGSELYNFMKLHSLKINIIWLSLPKEEMAAKSKMHFLEIALN